MSTQDSRSPFTSVYARVTEGYVAFVEELPGANSQGATLEEARENLAETAELVMQANREIVEQDLVGQDVTRDPFSICI